MPDLAKRILNVKPSSTLAITALAKGLKNEGKDVISFAAGEPDFDTPEHIKNAAKSALDSGFTKYTPASGTNELKNAICNKFLRENKLKYKPEEIVVSCGAKHALYNIFQVMCDPGDEVLIISPYWLSYPEMVRLAEAKPVIIKTDETDGFKVRPGKLKNNISKKTKALILNSPSNPAGVVYNKKELEEIADIAVSKKITVVSDEIYEKLIYDGEKHISIGSLGADVYKRVITVNGVSKTYSMTGWRIGYLGADSSLAKAISTLQSHSTSNPASISQKAAEEALNTDESVIEKMRLEFEDRRDCMMEMLDGINDITYVKPVGAFYIYCNISKTGYKALDFARKLLEEKMVAVIPGTDFGSDDHVRLTFAVSLEKIKTGLGRLKQWLKQ